MKLTKISLALLSLLFVACEDGPKEISFKNSNGVEITSYQQACSMGDFESAHIYIAKMSEPNSGYSTYFEIPEAKQYVFREEVLYLISQDDERAQKRILFLLKQDPQHIDSHCEMLIDLLIANDDEEFLKTVIKQYQGTLDQSFKSKIVEYFYVEKGDEHVDYLKTLLNRHGSLYILAEAATVKGDETLLISLIPDLEYLSMSSVEKIMEFLTKKNNADSKKYFNTLASKVSDKEEVIKYATSKGFNVQSIITEMMEDRILSLSKSGVDVLSTGLCDDMYSAAQENASKITEYNNRCIRVLEQAISYKSLKYARKVISIMKPNVVHHYGNSNDPQVDGVVIGYDKEYIQHQNYDIKRAKEILNEAIRSGSVR